MAAALHCQNVLSSMNQRQSPMVLNSMAAAFAPDTSQVQFPVQSQSLFSTITMTAQGGQSCHSTSSLFPGR